MYRYPVRKLKGENKALKWLPTAVKCHACTFHGSIRFNAYNVDSRVCNEQ